MTRVYTLILRPNEKNLTLLKEFKDLVLLVSKWLFGQYEMSFEDNMIMKDEDIIEVEHCTSKLVDMALGPNRAT